MTCCAFLTLVTSWWSSTIIGVLKALKDNHWWVASTGKVAHINESISSSWFRIIFCRRDFMAELRAKDFAITLDVFDGDLIRIKFLVSSFNLLVFGYNYGQSSNSSARNNSQSNLKTSWETLIGKLECQL